MNTREYDVVVLGGGIAGYTAAVRASQLGMKAAVIERDKLGGTCLHRGCIPSKSLLRSAEVLHTIRSSEQFGIQARPFSFQFSDIQSRKNRVVEQLYRGLQGLMKKYQIEIIQGIGRINGPSIFSPRSGAVALELPDGDVETIVPKHLIIAVGSRPRSLPGLDPDSPLVMTSDEALDMESLPDSILIIGGGVIGVEWASMLNDFGVQVTIIEAAEHIVPNEDLEVSRLLARSLQARGVRIMTGSTIDLEQTDVTGSSVRAIVKQGDETVEVTADKLLVSIGRQANTEELGLGNTDIETDNGFIKVNEHFQTTERHIYAVGDVTGGLQLAHAAARQAVIAVEHMAGKSPVAYDPLTIPRCIYTRPEVASFGMTEKSAREQGREVKIGKFPMSALGKALVQGDSEGFVKVVADARTNDIIGVHMIGPQVTNLISEAALARLLDATPWEVGQLAHPHPTLSEAIGEAMLGTDGLALNI